MSKEVTLVKEGANPSTYKTSSQRTITQLKSQGYRVADGGEVPETGYRALKLDELRTEVDRRNADRGEDEQIVVAGRKKDDYAAALEADDDAQNPGGEE